MIFNKLSNNLGNQIVCDEQADYLKNVVVLNTFSQDKSLQSYNHCFERNGSQKAVTDCSRL